MTQPAAFVDTSVIIPTYNRAGLIGECLESVLSQTCPPREVLVIDDGSTDHTREVLRAFERHITLITQANAGVSAARNAGLSRAAGAWITFIDSDDIWTRDRLEILQRDVAGAPARVCAHFANLRVTGPGYDRELFEIKKCQFPRGAAQEIPDALALVIPGTSPQSVAVRRETALKVGGFDPAMRIGGDTLLFCLVALEGPWLVTGDVVAEVRRVPTDKVALRANASRIDAINASLSAHQKLLEAHPTTAQRRLVSNRYWWLTYELARAQNKTGTGNWRANLVRYLANRSRSPKAWLKFVPAYVFGNLGFRVFEREAFSREAKQRD